MDIDLSKIFSERAMYCEFHPAYDPTTGMDVTKGCKHCTVCKLVWILGNYKTDEARQVALDRLERMTHLIMESVQKGTFDHNLTRPLVKKEN